MLLQIITPTGRQMECRTEKVFLPGASGSFEVLKNHAPVLSALEKGVIRFEDGQGVMQEFALQSGFVKVKDNVVTVCCE